MPLGRRFVIRSPRLTEVGPFQFPDEPPPGQMLMRVSHSLISPGTELLNLRTHSGGEPLAVGYTAVGSVVAVGAGVDPAAIGGPFFLFPAFVDQARCHATHKVLAPDPILMPLPEGLDPAKACFARMVNVSLTPFCHLDPRTNGTCLVVGLGVVGNLAAQIARLRGFRVIGIDPDAARRARAAEVGVHHLIDPAGGDAVAQVRALTRGKGANFTINATGAAATFPMAIEATASGGELSNLGGSRGSFTTDLALFLTHTFNRHVTVRGGWEMALPRRDAPGSRSPCTEENLRQALDWLATDAIQLKSIWTHTIAPDRMPEAYTALAAADPAWLGVVVDWRNG